MLSDSCCSTRGSYDDGAYVIKVLEIIELLIVKNTSLLLYRCEDQGIGCLKTQ